MTKKKADKVFGVLTSNGEEIIVLARHSKGARTVAHKAGYTVLPSKSNVVEADQAQAHLAINGGHHE